MISLQIRKFLQNTALLCLKTVLKCVFLNDFYDVQIYIRALYIVRLPLHPATPLVRNSLNGCQGHPPLCLSPRTAQRLPGRIQTVFGRAVFIQVLA